MNKKQQNAPKSQRTTKNQVSKKPVIRRKAANNAVSARMNSEMSAIVASIVMPVTNHPVRWPSEFSTADTALASPFDVIPLGVPNAVTNTLGEFDLFAAVFRDAERAYVIYDPNGGNLTCQYDAHIKSLSSTLAPALQASLGIEEDWTPLHVSFLTPTASVVTYAAHGPILYCGADGETNNRYFWHDDSTTVTFTQVSGGNTVVRARFWDHGISEVSATRTIVTVGTAVFTPFVSGYYCYEIQNDAVTICQLKSVTTDSIFQHHALPDFEKNMASAQGVRIMGASLMYSNDASDLNRQGKITGLQAPQETLWRDYAFGGFELASKALGSATMPIKNGLFEFLKPTKPEDFQFSNHIRLEGTLLFDSFFPLKEETSYLILFGEIKNFDGQDGYWSVDFAVEYQTTDVWREKSQAIYSAQEARVALEQLKNIPQFYENPKHLESLWKTIKSIFKTTTNAVVKYGPTIIPIAAQIAAAL